MKNLAKYGLLCLLLIFAFTSCRNTEKDDETELEQLMNDPDNDVEIKDGGDKIKIETKDGDEIKIKQEDGDYKKKVETADGQESKLKKDNGEIKEKIDN